MTTHCWLIALPVVNIAEKTPASAVLDTEAKGSEKNTDWVCSLESGVMTFEAALMSDCKRGTSSAARWRQTRGNEGTMNYMTALSQNSSLLYRTTMFP